MAEYVKQIDDYLIKDEEARQSIETANTNISNLVNKSNEHTTKINEHTDTLSALTSSNNTNGANLSLLQNSVNAQEERISNLEELTHLKLTYNASTETITFEAIKGA